MYNHSYYNKFLALLARGRLRYDNVYLPDWQTTYTRPYVLPLTFYLN